MLTAKDILQALRILKAADPKTVQQILADEAVNKAGGERHAQGLDGAPWIPDLHTEGEEHTVITGEEIKVGPSQGASGGGAEKMIREYSQPAPQKGVTQEAMSLAEVLGGIGRSMKAMADSQKTMGDLLTVLVAAKAEEKDEKDDEEEEAKAHAKARAAELVAEATKLLRKADRKEEDGDDEEESEKSRVLYREAKLLRKQAARMLGKARLQALAAGDKEITKSIRAIVAKADLVIKAEDEEEEKEREKEKKEESEKSHAAADPAATAAKGSEATKDSAGNQAAKQNKENGNQDDAAQKAVADLNARMEEALKGFTILRTDIAGFMDVVAGKTKPQEGATGGTPGATPQDAFALIKSNPEGAVGEITVAIEKANAAGLIDGAEAMTAYNILGKLDAHRQGVVPKSMVDGMIDNAPSAVRQIFRHAA